MTGLSTGLGRAAWLVFERDVRLAFRRWEQVTHPVVFFVMVASLFPLALSPEPSLLRSIAPGVVWVAALLSSMLALDSLFRADLEDGTLEQLTLSGQPLGWLLLAKTLAHWCLSGVPLVVAAPLVAEALAAPGGSIGVLMTALLLGTGVLSFLGAVGAALTLGSRRGSVLLSLLVLPLAMPVLIFGARATDLAMRGETATGPLLLLAAMLILAVTLSPLAAAAAVRISLE
ncbi:MAG TPA: heme exporter protein CcmB [Steroidobacteraceae bacterium]|nr:heme exporter protein CcmB [Steroidobacteraceae bacterium]